MKNIKKIRFLEPGNPPYRRSLKNFYTYDKYIRTPSTGLLTLATVANSKVPDTLFYSESISKIKWKDVLDADIIFISIFTFNANRGYELAKFIKQNSNAVIAIGGLHASLNYEEAIQFCDYVLLGDGDELILDFLDAIDNNSTIKFKGVIYKNNDKIVNTGKRKPPENIDTIPDRHLLYDYKKKTIYNTIWLQVHASRGCPHDCNYCAVVRHFGHKVRKRSPQNIVEDIRQCIEFHKRKIFPRFSNVLWITDDNFFADRKWAISVLNAIIESKIKFKFTIQARFEVGFDDEMLQLLKKAGFVEIAMGIEFLEDEAFDKHNKRCGYEDIVKSVQNIQKHGLNVRGLFIVGADNHEKGIGKKLSDFVINYDIKGVLIQSMYFIPGTPVYDDFKDRLIHSDWSKYNGHVVHYPAKISPYNLQKEIIIASRNIYSLKRFISVMLKGSFTEKFLFAGEMFWQRSVRKNLKKEMKNLKRLPAS